jgi:hypothetical protein
MDSGSHSTDYLANMLCLEDEPGDKLECFYDSGFIGVVDNIDGYDEYIGPELILDLLVMMQSRERW